MSINGLTNDGLCAGEFVCNLLSYRGAGNCVNDEGTCALAAALAGPMQLTYLVLSGTSRLQPSQIWSQIDEARGSHVHGEAPQTLSDNGICDRGTCALADVLAQTKLLQLRLCGTFDRAQQLDQLYKQPKAPGRAWSGTSPVPITGVGTSGSRRAGCSAAAAAGGGAAISAASSTGSRRALTGMLRACGTENGLREEGARALAKALPLTQLTELHLDGNRLCEGIRALESVLAQTQLVHFDARTCVRLIFGDCDCIAIASLTPRVCCFVRQANPIPHWPGAGPLASLAFGTRLTTLAFLQRFAASLPLC